MLWLFLILPVISVTSRSFSIQDESKPKAVSDRLIELVTQGAFRGVTYSRLAAVCDTFGSRLCGNESLTKAVDWVENAMKMEGLDNVHVEPVTVPHWVRGEERAQLIQPRNAELSMLGLGTSIGTGPNGIQGPVLVVRTFDELDAKCNEARNKIVVFNPQCDWVAQPTGCYGVLLPYLGSGAPQAAKCGAIACLCRSAASQSIDSPQTGLVNYVPSYPKIPAGTLSVEHTDMLDRFQQRNQSIELFLYMEAQTLPDVIGYNLIAEIKGSTLPNETVLVSGHFDSWDVGQGAMDNGGGAMISWTVLSLLRALNIRAKRTIRCILWTCGEFRHVGSMQYFADHKAEMPHMSILMESNNGVFHPLGLEFNGNNKSREIIQTISAQLKSINTTQVVLGSIGSDIGPWEALGVPAAGLLDDNRNRYAYHHSNGDTVNVYNSTQVDLGAAVWAVYAYAIADLDNLLPR